MKFYLAVTDNNWYHYLSQLHTDQINFRQLCVSMPRRRGDMDVIGQVPTTKSGSKLLTMVRHFSVNSYQLLIKTPKHGGRPL